MRKGGRSRRDARGVATRSSRVVHGLGNYTKYQLMCSSSIDIVRGVAAEEVKRHFSLMCYTRIWEVAGTVGPVVPHFHRLRCTPVLLVVVVTCSLKRR